MNENIPKEVEDYYKVGKRELLKIEANRDHTLILFYNDSKRIYDLSNQLIGVFQVLKDIDKFMTVFIDEDGNIAWDIDPNLDSSIHWNNRIDICSDSAYIYSKAIN